MEAAAVFNFQSTRPVDFITDLKFTIESAASGQNEEYYSSSEPVSVNFSLKVIVFQRYSQH